MQAKKLPMVEDLRDESDHENPTRLVITPRSNRVDVEGLMAHLFATTDLERTYRVNLTMIGLDGRPQQYNLRDLLARLAARSASRPSAGGCASATTRSSPRLHILDGYLIAYLNIDEVIRIIRTEDEPKPVLMARFHLTDAQAEAILELKLRHIARLEEMKIRGEQAELVKERDELEKILSSERPACAARCGTSWRQDAKTFGDRPPLADRGAREPRRPWTRRR